MCKSPVAEGSNTPSRLSEGGHGFGRGEVVRVRSCDQSLGGHGKDLIFILRPSKGELLKDSKQRCDIIRFCFGKATWTTKRSVFWREARIGVGT